MEHNGIKCSIHYLNDYLFLGRSRSQQCAEALRLALSLCQTLGVPVSMGKIEGPATTLAFLGIQLDTMAMELRDYPQRNCCG